MRASVPAGGWGNCFFVVKIEGAGGFLVAGTFFYCMAALWKLPFAFLVIGAVCAV